MKQRTSTNLGTLALATGGAMALFTTPAAAREHHEKAAYRILFQETLTGGSTTDLFLRQDKQGHRYLYRASDNGTLSVFDVSRPEKSREINSLILSSSHAPLQIRPVSENIAVASAASNTGEDLAILDFAEAPAAQLVKVLRNVDAYAIDGATNTLYAAQKGKLVILQFEHPLTREAEIWEQSYESR